MNIKSFKNEKDFIKKEDWIWLPHAAHFIGSGRCYFRMATVVGDFIISTVGDYHPYAYPNCPEEDTKEEIGLDRFYETMVFNKKLIPENQCDCCQFGIEGENIDFRGYLTSRFAMNGHLEFCEKYSKLFIDITKKYRVNFKDDNKVFRELEFFAESFKDAFEEAKFRLEKSFDDFEILMIEKLRY